MRNRMIVLRSTATAFFFALILSFSSQAQASDRPLLNMKEFGLRTAGFDEDSEACGVSEGLIKATAVIYSKALPFKVVDSVEQHSLLSFGVETFRAKDRCITHIYTLADYSVIARLPHAREDSLARILLWDRTEFIVTAPDPKVHRSAVVKAVMDHLRVMAEDWGEQNQTRL
jgi:hypothetical protein